MAEIKLAHPQLEAWIEEQLTTRGEVLIALEAVDAELPALRRVVHQIAKQHGRRGRTRLIEVIDNPDKKVLHADFPDWPRDDHERELQAKNKRIGAENYRMRRQPGQPRPPRKRSR